MARKGEIYKENKMHICVEKRIQRRLAAPIENLWENRIIKVQFLGGIPRQKKLVMKYAQEWMEYANIEFEFTVLPGIIRVSFKEGQGSWSYVGKEALQINNKQPTVNFGWLTKDVEEEEARRVILHEFGHVLGMTHEHKSPASSIPWNKKAVYDFYKGPPNFWDKETVDTNLFNVYQGEMTNSEYDPKSIMHYPIPNELTIGDYSVGWNDNLSNQDKEFIGKIYP